MAKTQVTIEAALLQAIHTLLLNCTDNKNLQSPRLINKYFY